MSTIRDATELDYNAASRCIEFKVEIFFTSTPLTVTRDNYLIDLDLLEETSADSNTPFGSISANEVSFSLYNDDGMFSPTSSSSPYHGLIKAGLKVQVYQRPVIDDVTCNWIPMGTFYVTDWNTQITGGPVEVTATDKLQSIFNKPELKLPVTRNSTFSQVFTNYFTLLDEQASVDSSLTEVLSYVYNTGDHKSFLNDLAIGAQAYVFCNRSGIPTVLYARRQQTVQHVITDANQIISISAMQNIILDYDGSEVIAHYPQESAVQSLVSMSNVTVPVGTYTSDVTKFLATPAIKVVAVRLNSTGHVSVKSIEATSVDAQYKLVNSTESPVVTTVDILGTKVEAVPTTFSDYTDRMLSVNNIYIQNSTYASDFKEMLDAYVTSTVPMLTVQARGNAFYKLGEKMRVVSTTYSVDFTGVLVRQTFSYDGSLSSSLTFINSTILEV